MTNRAHILPLLLVTGACSLTPKLTLPTPPVATSYPVSDATAGEALPEWRTMYRDPRLQRLIALALADNRDLRIAALNADAARAQLRVQRAQALPMIGAEAGYVRQRIPSGVAGAAVGVGTPTGNGATSFEFGQFTAQGTLASFEIDLFGRLRALNEAAFQRWLSTSEARRAVRLTVIGAVVDAYLSERLAEEQLRLTQATLDDWRTSLDITRRLRAAGQSSGVEVAQAEGLVRQAQADLAQRDRERMQATNALTLAVGAPPPADLPPPIALMNQPVPTMLAAGTPSDLLLHRPDIAQAEHELRAANADIGAARAAFFPRLSLTGALSVTSLAFGGLFNAANRSWSFAPSITAPIFRSGELRGSLDLARLRTSVAVATYERAIQIAFREVADGLAGRATYANQLNALQESARQADRRKALAALSYSAGLTGRLELLDAQRTSYAAHQATLVVRRDELASASALYRALGGDIERRLSP